MASEYSFDYLSLDMPRPAILVATLDRPDRLNALSFAMFDELGELCDRASADPDVRVLILTGAGRGFCAGMDLGEVAKLTGMTAATFTREQERWAGAITSFVRTGMPVIAAINGPASGAGFSLALAADIRIASPSARFNAAFLRIGLTGGDCGSSWLLPRVVGMGHASEMLLTGRLVDAAEAARIGLVNRVVPENDLLDAAIETASYIVANSPLGVRLTKQALLVNANEPSLHAAIELENRNQALAALTEDHHEALAAFMEKRNPVFQDR